MQKFISFCKGVHVYFTHPKGNSRIQSGLLITSTPMFRKIKLSPVDWEGGESKVSLSIPIEHLDETIQALTQIRDQAINEGHAT